MLLLRAGARWRLARRAEPAIHYAERRVPVLAARRRPRSATVAGCSPRTGRRRPRSGCRDGAAPAAGRGCATRRWPPPTGGWCARPRRPARDRDGADRGGPPRLVRRLRRRGDRRVLPARRCWTAPGRRTPGCSPVPTWRAGGATVEEPVTLRLWRLHRVQDRAVGPGAGASCSNWRCWPASTWTRMEPARRRLRAHGDRVRQAGLRRPRGLVRRPASPTCRWPTCCREAYNAERRRADRRRAPSPASCGPGSPGRPRRPGCRRTRRAATALGAEPTVAPAPASRPCAATGGTRGDTCHLDVVDRLRQHGLGHAQRRLAAELAGRSPGWASALGTPGADVLAAGGPARPRCAPGTRPRTTLSPVAGAARRRAVAGVRHARR